MTSAPRAEAKGTSAEPLLGLSVGVVSGTASGDNEGGVTGASVTVDAGVKLTSKWAVLLEGTGLDHVYVTNGAHALHTMELGMLQVTPTAGFWIRGGVGAAQLIDGDTEQRKFMAPPSHGGLAVAGAVGCTVWRQESYSIGVELSAAHATYQDAQISSGSVLIAFKTE